jgi:hypothetical protein
MIFYEGLSLFNDEPIVGIITTNSHNRKTGSTLQAWILNAALSPFDKHADAANCGTCPIKPACYVNKAFAPNNVFKKFKSGGYPTLDKRILKNEFLRIGAYGDPAAIPTHVWRDLTKRVIGYTGYTHQWAECDQDLRYLVMASTESPELNEQAQKLGWKTFRIKTPDEVVLKNETECLNETQGSTCKNCGLCNGNRSNIVINVHGTRHKIYQFKAIKGHPWAFRFERSIRQIPTHILLKKLKAIPLSLVMPEYLL